MLRFYALVIILFIYPGYLYAQTTKVTQLNAKRIQTNKGGMMVLGSWAIANMAMGAIGMKKNTGTQRYFHQMNLMWNSVNLALAGSGLYSAYTSSPSQFNLEQGYKEQQKIERILLVNAGLDVVYIAGGLVLKQRSVLASAKRPELMNGYGKSLMLQGGFLLGFDSILFLLHKQHHNDWMQLLGGLQATTSGFRYVGSF